MDGNEELPLIHGKLLVKVETAAQVADVGRTTGYALVSSGQWPSIKIGRARRVIVEGLRDWIERHTDHDARAIASDGEGS